MIPIDILVIGSTTQGQGAYFAVLSVAVLASPQEVVGLPLVLVENSAHCWYSAGRILPSACVVLVE